MRLPKIIIATIIMFAACILVNAQVAQYKIHARTSVISKSSIGDSEVTILNRVERPFVGVSTGSSFIIVSGKTQLDDVRSMLGLDDHILAPGNETEQVLPEEFMLHSNYPNPFNPSTTIRYYLAENSNVVIKVYKILGQEVCTLVQENQTAGEKSIVWNGRNSAGQIMSTGVYICRVVAGSNSKSIKMLLMK